MTIRGSTRAIQNASSVNLADQRVQKPRFRAEERDHLGEGPSLTLDRKPDEQPHMHSALNVRYAASPAAWRRVT